MENEEQLYLQFKNGEVSIEDLVQGQKVRFLIMIRAEQKILAQYDKDLMESLKDDINFSKADVEGVTVMKKDRPTIKLRSDADLLKIRSLYPDICKSQNVLHQDKLSEKVWEYLKAQPEAVEEVITVDAKKLNEVTKEYTEQTVTTYIEVKGL